MSPGVHPSAHLVCWRINVKTTAGKRKYPTHFRGILKHNLQRSVEACGTFLGSDDYGRLYVQDGRVYRFDKHTAEMIGKYGDFCDEVRRGLHPTFVLIGRPIQGLKT